MRNPLVIWWQSTLATGASVLPYVGVAILIGAAIAVTVILGYLLYRVLRRSPPAIKYVWWRIRTWTARAWAVIHDRRRPGARVRAREFHSPRTEPLAECLQSTLGRKVFGLWRRHVALPGVIVIGPRGAGKTTLITRAMEATSGAPLLASVAAPLEDVVVYRLASGKPCVELNAGLLDPGSDDRFTSIINLVGGAGSTGTVGAILLVLPIQLVTGEGREGGGVDGAVDSIKPFFDAAVLASRVAGARLPTYVVITGTDRLEGFGEYATLVSGVGAEQGEGSDTTLSVDFAGVIPRDGSDAALAQLRETALSRMLSRCVQAGPGDRGFEARRAFAYPEGLAAVLGKLLPSLTGMSSTVADCEPLLQRLTFASLGGADATANRRPRAAARSAVQGALRALVDDIAPIASAARERVRRRQVAAALAALVISVVGGIPWAIATWSRVGVSTVALVGALNSIKYQVRYAAGVGQDVPLSSWDHAGFADYLAALRTVSKNPIRTLLVPSSYISPTIRRYDSIFATTASRLYIAPRLAEIRINATRFGREGLTTAGRAVDGINQQPGYPRFAEFLREQELFRSNSMQANHMAAGVSYEDLLNLMGLDSAQLHAPNVSWTQKLPADIATRIQVSQPDLTRVSEAARQTLTSYWNELLDESFDLNPLAESLRLLKQEVSLLEVSDGHSYEHLRNIDRQLKRIEWLTSSPTGRVLLGTHADALSFCEPAIVRLGESNVVPTSLAVEFSSQVSRRYTLLHTRMLDMEINGVGHVFVDDPKEKVAHLSDEMRRFIAAMKAYMAQPFMQQADIDPNVDDIKNRSVMWSISQLSMTLRSSAAFRDFRESGSRAFDPVIRDALIRAAADNHRRIVDKAFVSAAYVPHLSLGPLPESMSGGPIGTSAGTNSVDEHARNLAEAVKIYRAVLLEDWTRDGLGAPPHAQELLRSQIQTVLEDSRGMLLATSPYASLFETAQSWLADTNRVQLSGNPLAMDARSRLAMAVQNIRSSFGSYVFPLLDAANGLALAERDTDAGNFWRAVRNGLDAYEKASPDASLYELETYVTDFSRLDQPTGCRQFLAQHAAMRSHQDYFYQQLAGFDNALQQSCRLLFASAGQSRYRKFAAFFNSSVSGRAPFAENPSPLTTRLSAGAVMTVLDTYWDFRKQTPFKGEAVPDAVSGFLARMDKLVATFLGDLTPSEGVAQVALSNEAAHHDLLQRKGSDPAIHATLKFRSDRLDEVGADQIIGWSATVGSRQYANLGSPNAIEWHVGDSIAIQFRWATGSTFLPVGVGNGHDGVQVRGRTATFVFHGDWALFDLLREHLATDARGLRFNQLQFDIPVIGPKGRQITRVFLDLSGPNSAPDFQQFPGRAPNWDSGGAEQ